MSINWLDEEEPKRIKAKKEALDWNDGCQASKSTSEEPQSRMRRKFSVLLLPGDDREFSMLPADVQRKIEIDYTDRKGPPHEFEDCTVQQLSGLAARLSVDEAPEGGSSIFFLAHSVNATPHTSNFRTNTHAHA